jgi:carbamoyl-phosphate synthase large subunit
VEDVLSIYQKEKPEGVIVQFGGQTPLNICKALEQAGVNILGTSTDTIDLAEDRARFRAMMQKLGIPQPASGMAHNLEEALAIANRIGYPLMVRPSYVLGGRGMEVVHDQEELSTYVLRAVDIWPELPILIDKFLENALEMEADAISDGKDAFIPAIMEHIELAGIHSGDSACVLPPVSIAPKHQKIIEEYTKRIAIELKVLGLINIQYAIADDTVYILEANPRASRTVPIVSKVCNIQMVRHATQLMMGKKMSDLQLHHKAISHYGVKEAVFPFNMFHEVDPILGPEMRSTGEVLGMADSFELAFYKAQEAAQQLLPQQGAVLISVSDCDKNEALGVARDFSTLGFKLKATEGTHLFLTGYGIECDKILKMNSGRPNIVDAIKNGEIQLVVNTPVGKQGTEDDSYIRKTAIKHKIPYVTTMAAARAAAKGIAAYRRKETTVVSLQQYHAGIK